MLIGHFGVGFAAKRVSREVSLGTLLMASQFIDLIWPLLLLLGLERVEIDPGNTAFTPLDFVYYPITHSLFSVVVWAILFGVVYYFIKKRITAAVTLGALVVSHWCLDLVVHGPDLPLLPWSDLKVGLGLWNSVPLSILIESLIFATGAFVYFKTTRSLNWKGRVSLWSLLIFLTVIYLMNIFGPPPTSARSIGWIGLAQWLLVAWGFWIDRNRSTAPPDRVSSEPGSRPSVSTEGDQPIF